MEKNSAKEIWENTWTHETHITDYALKRIHSAKSAKLTPIKIDTTDFYGYFQGSNGRYETFLDYCPCGDFRRNNLPCKHIYRLAIELGLMNYESEQNINAIVTPKKERVSLDETLDIIEGLSINAQHQLLNISRNIRSTCLEFSIYLNDYDCISELINSGIIVDSGIEKHRISFGRKNEISNLLDDNGIHYAKKMKKDALEELCIKHIPEKAKSLFGEIINVSIPTKFSPKKIHYYLHRKFDSLSCVDEYMNEYELPLLETELPEDEITDQLIKRGYYIPSNKKVYI